MVLGGTRYSVLWLLTSRNPVHATCMHAWEVQGERWWVVNTWISWLCSKGALWCNCAPRLSWVEPAVSGRPCAEGTAVLQAASLWSNPTDATMVVAVPGSGLRVVPLGSGGVAWEEWCTAYTIRGTIYIGPVA